MGFGRNLVAVSIVHLLAVLAIMMASVVPGCRQKPRPVKIMPVQLIVGGPPAPARTAPQPVKAIPQPAPPEPLPSPPKAVPPPPKEIKKTQIKPPSNKKPPQPKPRPRPSQRPASRPRLTKEQIEKELLGTTTKVSAPVIASGDTMSVGEIDADLAMVWQTFYDAWNQPSYEDVGEATADVSIELALDGTVLGRTLVRSSGNAVMDGSVMQAAEAVRQIDGLSREFTERNRHVTVQFKVKQDE